MLRILIAEDEDFERKALKYLINKNFHKDKVAISEASNGREALDQAILFKPDIVLMDINMPIMDGLDASERIKDINSEIDIIILSAYDEFEFARRAIKSGICDYLVKPFTEKDFLISLNTVIQRRRTREQQRQDQLNIRKNYDKAIPFIEKELMTQIIYGDYSECCKMEESKRILDIDSPVGCSIIIGSRENYTFKEITLKKIKEIFGYLFNKVIAARLLGDIVIFVFDDNVEHILLSSKMEEIINLIKNQFHKRDGIGVEIGIGSIAKNIDEFSSSYNKARIELKTKITHHGLENEESGVSQVIQSEIENMISGKIINEDLKGAMEKTKELVDGLFISSETTDLTIIKSSIFESLVKIRAEVLSFVDVHEDNLSNETIKSELSILKTISDINNYLSIFNNRLMNLVSEYKNTNNIEIINKAKEFIDRNYMNDIRLEDVSQEVSISSYYFSRLFKRYEGLNYIQYLTKVRMEKAKKMIIEGKYQIKEIAFEVGYLDQNYFSRVFKKYFGESPSEFATNIKQYKLGGIK